MRVRDARVAATSVGGAVWAIWLMLAAVAVAAWWPCAAQAQTTGEDEWGDSPREATPVALPLQITVRKNKEGDQDWCAVELERGQIVTVGSVPVVVRAPQERAVDVYWIDGSYRFIAEATGRYNLGVQYGQGQSAVSLNLDTSATAYSTRLAAMPFDQPDGQPESIRVGEWVTVRSDFGGDVDIFDLSLEGGRMLEVEIDESAHPGTDGLARGLSIAGIEAAQRWQPNLVATATQYTGLSRTEWYVPTDPMGFVPFGVTRWTGVVRMPASEKVRLRVQASSLGSAASSHTHGRFRVRDLGARPTRDEHPADWREAPWVALDEPVRFFADATPTVTNDIDYVRIAARAGHVYDLSLRNRVLLNVRAHDGRLLYWFGNETLLTGSWVRCVQALADGPLYIGIEWGGANALQPGCLLTVRDRGWFPLDRDMPQDAPGLQAPAFIDGTLGARGDVDTHVLALPSRGPLHVWILTDDRFAWEMVNLWGVTYRNAGAFSFSVYGPDYDFATIRHVQVRALSAQFESKVFLSGSYKPQRYLNASTGLPFTYRVISHRAGPVADIASAGGTREPDGQFSTDDIVVFVGAFFSGDAWLADVTGGPRYLLHGPNPDGAIDIEDLLFFVDAWFSRR